MFYRGMCLHEKIYGNLQTEPTLHPNSYFLGTSCQLFCVFVKFRGSKYSIRGEVKVGKVASFVGKIFVVQC